MAKKKSILGKMIAFTTTVAAIGGVCYVFRDKIKESSIYHGVVNGLSSLMDKHDKYTDDDDFLFDDEDDIFDSDDTGREYTSITINKSEPEADNTDKKDDTENIIVINEEIKTEKEDEEASAKEEDDTDSISVFGASIPEAFNTATADENEGLSDFDDDPDVLADQDKLDF